ncbi:MAG: apolipoprotein N-acyltransferase [Spirochaetales bacterium]|nr:apolipoprotein N-acyltransferase [Spirochaetales bacterium]
MSRSVGRICAGFYLAVSLAVSYIAFGSPIALEDPGLGDMPYFVLIGLHYLWGAVLFLSSTEYRQFSRGAYRRLIFVPELLAAASLLFFLFSFIFATNANMDYVQRFIQSGGNLRLALDTDTERFLVWVRVFPLVAVNVGAYFLFRFGRYRTVLAAGHRPGAEADRIVRPWTFLLTLLSAFLATVAMPSFLSLDGFALLGWIAFVPLLLVLRTSRPGHALFYGVVFGTFQTLLSSYWLGTFSLVSLQIIVLFFFIYYLIFTPIVVHMHRVSRWARVLIFPLAWTLFEYLRSAGFLGYPWALAAHSQYAILPVIQMAGVTGVWGVSFLVMLVNSAVAEFLGSVFARTSARRTAPGREVRQRLPGVSVRRSFGWLTAVAAALGAIVLTSSILLAVDSETDHDTRVVRVAQIQQNNDPRKHAYEDTLATLQHLTDAAAESDPALIVWSETAIVPNLRRWSVDTSSSRYHRLVNEFLEYQAGLQTWLVTGNDDYEIVRNTDDTGDIRFEYNAAVLFSDSGLRVETYRKIRLVPFTEHFPYKDRFPWIYELLQDFDVHFWEPGVSHTVFEHPDVKFSTPICYEDVFPDYVRGFVLEGAEAIFNISNDYWSLTEVQAKQHFVAGLFRAVENRRPVLRTTASGLTGQIDIHGRVIQTAPYYQEATLVSDVVIANEQPLTIYTRFGDYFPLGAGAVLLVIWFSSVVAAMVGRRRARRETTADSPPEPIDAPPPNSPASPATPSAPAPDQSAQADDTTPAPAARNRNPLHTLGKPLGGRRKTRRKQQRTNWREIWK